MASLLFPEWLYGGPYLTIVDPDKDLPRRDPSSPVSPERQRHVEREGILDGERVIAPFGDANTLEDIRGYVLVGLGYPDAWDHGERYRYPTIQGLLSELGLRIQARIKRSSSRVKRNWFGEALKRVEESQSLFAAREYEAARAVLSEAGDLLEQGNKASRRRVTFSVGPDGTASKQ